MSSTLTQHHLNGIVLVSVGTPASAAVESVLVYKPAVTAIRELILEEFHQLLQSTDLGQEAAAQAPLRL